MNSIEKFQKELQKSLTRHYKKSLSEAIKKGLRKRKESLQCKVK